MKRRLAVGLGLAVCAAADAAEPAAPSPDPAAKTVAEAMAPASVPARTSQPVNPAAKPATKPLDLRIGDVRTYMMPNEYRAVLGAPDAERDTVVVEGRKELLPVDYEKPIPMGPLMPLWWGLTHPTQSWRIFLPDLNRPADGPPDPIPPREFRWGP
jgi:hypothetical protein